MVAPSTHNRFRPLTPSYPTAAQAAMAIYKRGWNGPCVQRGAYGPFLLPFPPPEITLIHSSEAGEGVRGTEAKGEKGGGDVGDHLSHVKEEKVVKEEREEEVVKEDKEEQEERVEGYEVEEVDYGGASDEDGDVGAGGEAGGGRGGSRDGLTLSGGREERLRRTWVGEEGAC